jgi:hypothetical protein
MNRPRKPGRPKGSTGPTRARVVQLFDAGHSAPDIARRLGTTRANVYAHLKDAGRDARATGQGARAAERAQARKRFAAAWNAAPTIEAAAEAVGLSEATARARASVLRSRGLRLKQFPPRPTVQPSPRRDRIEALWRQCVRDVEKIVRRSGASRSFVYVVLKQLRGPAGASHWTAEEDALLGTMTDGAVGARIGRTARAVRKRRASLGVPPNYRGRPSTRVEGRKAKG